MAPKKVVLKTNDLELHNSLIESYERLGYYVTETVSRRRYIFFGDVIHKSILMEVQFQ